MAETATEGRWITIEGRHTFIEKGETPADAIAKLNAAKPKAHGTMALYSDAKSDWSDGPINWTPERTQLHKQIVEHFIGDTKPVDHPRVVVMGGGPASGKSSIIKAGFVDDANHVLSNPDEVKEQLPDYNTLVAAKSPDAALYVHEESSLVGKQVTQAALEKSMNVLQDGTGNSDIDNLADKIASYRKNGAVSIVGEYVTCPTDMAQARALERGQKTGRVVPAAFIAKTHQAVSQILPEALKRNLFDEVRLWDTTKVTRADSPKPVLVMEQKGGVIKIHDAGLWKTFLAKGE